MSKNRHTKLFGSTSYRTLGCPAHYKRGLHIPDPPPSPAALEGTMLHEMCEKALKSNKSPDSLPGWQQLSDDQRNIVTTYVGLVRELAEGGRFYIEKRVESPSLHDEWFGTADTIIIKPPRLTLVDLKCGRVPVSVYEYDSDTEPNPQLGSYAISVIDNLKPEVAATITEVELIIVQPREGGIKRAVFTRRQLDRLKERLLEAAENAESDNPRAAVGPWCHFCKVKPVCETMRDHVYEQARLDFALEGGDPSQLGLVELHQVLAVADTAIEWGQSVKAYAERLLHEGETLDGWHLVPKRAKRVWKNEKAVERLLLEAGYELEEIVEEVLLSPARIDALMRSKGIRLDLTDYVESVSTGLKIAKIVKGKNDVDSDDDNNGWD